MTFSIAGLAVARGISIGRAVLVGASRVEVAHYFIEPSQVASEIDRVRSGRNAVDAMLAGDMNKAVTVVHAQPPRPKPPLWLQSLLYLAASRLAAIAREAVEGWAAAARCESGCQHGHECAPSAALVARLDALTGAAPRATLPAMASPTDPPPTRSPAAMLRDLETAAQELMRLHPATPHAPSVLALLTLARVEVGPDPGEPPPRT